MHGTNFLKMQFNINVATFTKRLNTHFKLYCKLTVYGCFWLLQCTFYLYFCLVQIMMMMVLWV